MKSELFHFKRFVVSHSRSSMKVGVDGVLIGAWADAGGDRILDAGTGCGVIALMMAQRNDKAIVTAIDIDSGSIGEANENFSKSPWGDRLNGINMNFCDVECNDKYDLIVSNPPFYDAGVTDLCSSRLRARHQGELSPFALIGKASSLLKTGGKLAMVVPSSGFDKICDRSSASGLILSRAALVRNHSSAPVKRVLLEFSNIGRGCKEISVNKNDIPVLTMFEENGDPTPEYRRLCGDFYLKF